MKTLFLIFILFVVYVMIRDKVISVNLTLLKARYTRIKEAVTRMIGKIKSLIVKLKI